MTTTLKGFPENLYRKRELRGSLTAAENRLWLRLRGRQIEGFKFRRQHGIGPYIVDFFCPERRMVIEVDGDVHAMPDRIPVDEEREEYLKRLGLVVVRYTNEEIHRNLDGVLEDLLSRLRAWPTSPRPSLQRRGD